MRITPKIWKRLFVCLVLIPAIPFVIGVIGMLAVANIAGEYATFNMSDQLNHESRHVVVLAHGKDASPATWIDALKFGNPGGLELSPQSTLLIPDWSDWAGNFLRVSLNGYHLGYKLGSQLLAMEKLESVHVVGHSAGGFFAYGVCQGVKQQNSHIPVQATYIAPLSLYRGFRHNFGTNHFGTCADFSDNYLDQDDHVPGANLPLHNAHAFDVTAIRQNPQFKSLPAHASPLYFYGLALVERRAPLLHSNPYISDLFAPGKTTIVNEPTYSFPADHSE